MAFARCVFFSNVLGMHMPMNVILPQPDTQHIGTATGKRSETGNYKIMYLLHGMSDDESIWGRMTAIERYAQGRNLIVVMPNAHRSYYMNMYQGGRYWDYISEELPMVVNDMFHVSDKQEDRFVCGLSMGGFGALHWALKRPDMFAGACSLSGVADIKRFHTYVGEDRTHEMERIFGPLDKLNESEDDLFYLVQEYLKQSNQKTRFMQICGTEDFLYQDNVNFRDFCRQKSFNCEYLEEPGSHTWEFWDKHVQTAMTFFGL